MPKDTRKAVVEEDDDDGNDEIEKESTRIFVFLRKNMDVSADVERDAPVNWISEKLLEDSGLVVSPAKYMEYQTSEGLRLRSKGRVKVFWRRSLRDKVLSDEFMVHAGKAGAPDVVLGKSWAQTHGESVGNAQRHIERGQRREASRSRTVSGSGQNTTKPVERQRMRRRVVDVSRR